MKPDDAENDKQDDPQERIDELENQVRELKGLVEVLLSKPDAPTTDQTTIEADPEQGEVEQTQPDHLDMLPGLGDKVHAAEQAIVEGVSKALGGEQGESLESRIGGIWLSRITAVLALTAIVLGGVVTLREEAIDPIYKLLIGYAVAACFIAYGSIARKRFNLFPRTALGTGLATLYFTTYAAFYLESVQVFSSTTYGVPALALCLGFIAAAIHRSKSQTTAGITLFLIYFTVVLSLYTGKTADNIYYALLTCSMASLVALAFHIAHRWLLFTWGALIATHLTYIWFFVFNSIELKTELQITDQGYFWISNGFLTVNYILFSVACISDARKRGEFRKTVGSMSGVNSFVYFVLTWIAIREYYVEQEWIFRAWFAIGLGVLAAYANWAGPRRNYLFQIYAAKTVIMFTLALQARLAHEWLLVAMAVECIGLAFSYKRAGIVMFKILGMLLLFTTFIGCLLAVKMDGSVLILGREIPANWFSCTVVPLVFAIVAWLYEHHIRRVHPENRVVKGQWFLADTIWDISSANAALLHAAAGAFILMTITIIDMGTDVSLPYILAGEAVVFAIVGLLLRTPQVEVASVLLIVACHVAFHTFLVIELPGFINQPRYVLYTTLVAILTYFGGYLWERYLWRIHGGRPWEHDAVASAPYLAATIMLTTLMGDRLESVQIAPAQGLLGLLLLAAGTFTRFTALRISGLVAIAIAAITFYGGILNTVDPLVNQPGFLVGLCVFLAALVGSERVMLWWKLRPTAAGIFRTIFVVLAAFVGTIGFWQWADEGYLTFFWIVLAVLTFVLGVVFPESRYRLTALILYLVAIIRAYSFDLTSSDISPLVRFLAFAALCLPLLIVSWGYSEFRSRRLQKSAARKNQEQTPDG